MRIYPAKFFSKRYGFFNFKIQSILNRQQSCQINSATAAAASTIRPKCKTNHELIEPVRKYLENGTVLVLNSENIFENLALEEWIYRNFDFSEDDRHLLLMWRNAPTVVLGRHQNVWSEVMVDFCDKTGVQIARRNSGGGTVYHDENNLNISFMTSKKCYNRKQNLSYISDILRTWFAIETEINVREDLIICDSGEKVSGTASKLNSHNSYHHCTLLVDVDRDKLRKSLRPKNISMLDQASSNKTRIESNATKSVPSPILNLKTLNDQICIDSLIQQLATNFSTQIAQLEPEQSQQIIKLTQRDIETNFKTIDEIKRTFESWSWRFGKTPKFSVITQFSWRTFPVIELTIVVEKGLIRSISVQSPEPDNGKLLNQIELTQFFAESKFDSDEISQSIRQFQLNHNSKQILDPELIDTVSLAIFNSLKFCTS